MNRLHVLTVVSAVFLLAEPGFSQRGSGATGTGTNGGGVTPPVSGNPGRGVTTNPNNPPMQPSQPQMVPIQPRTVFLSGRVMTDDGSPLNDTAVIETVCNGTPHAQAYTDTKGRFSFELGGRTSEVMQDASEGHMGGFGSNYAAGDPFSGGSALGLSSADRILMNCELQAKLPGYVSETLNLASHRSDSNPDVGTILVHRLGNVEGRVVSATTLAAPKDARKAFEKGEEALKKDKPQDALKQFQKAVAAYPDYATAWSELGKLQLLSKQMDDAAASFNAAIKADPKFVNPYLYLSIVQAMTLKWSDLEQTTAKALKLDPYDSAQAYFFNAMAHFNLHQMDAAEKSAREGQKIDKNHQYPRSWELLGLVLANKQDYAGAAEQWRAFLQYSPNDKDAARVRAQLEQIEKLEAVAKK